MIDTTIAHYRIRSLLGEGGMGQVYRATDTKLDREVALKLLPEEFTKDPERLERFRREARSLAALSHPNVGAIHGIEEADGRVALVLELIEGDTLADRVADGPLPVDEVVSIGLQIAAALEAAHEHGIVHRDLKPANVKITPGGQVKVLDFGLAKSGDRAGSGGADVTQSPTLMMTAMGPGLIMGTAAYMSPEQAKGLEVDRRADIWAYGATLCELLSGERLFDGDDLTEVLAAVISRDPDLGKLPADLPFWLRDLIERCLRRDPAMRLPDIAAARIALQERDTARPAAVHAGGAGSAAAARSGRVLPLAVAVALAAGALAGVLGYRALQPAPPEASTTYTELVLDPPPLPDALPIISPDGREVAYAGGSAMLPPMIYVRSLHDGGVRAIPGSEKGTTPAFSPDGSAIAFMASGRLKVAPVGGGLPEPLTAFSGTPSGSVWLPDGTIVFSTLGNRRLQRIPAVGGTATTVELAGEGLEELWLGEPARLPDPGRLLVAVQGPETGGARIAVLELETGELTMLARGSGPHFVAPSTLIFVQGDLLVAAPFDPVALEITGPEVAIEPAGARLTLLPGPTGDRAIAGIASSGRALFPMEAPDTRTLVWVGRDGTETSTGFTFDTGMRQAFAANGALGAALSPDGTRVALITDDTPMIVELADIERRRMLPKPGASVAYPRWHPDGTALSVIGNMGGSFESYLIPASGAGVPELMTRDPHSIVTSFAADGETYFGYVVTAEAGRDLWIFRRDGNHEPLLETAANERAPALSPDGRAFAYVSDTSGDDRIYLRLYPDIERAWAISQGGASGPIWSRDGTELYYRERNRMMAVSVNLTDGVQTGVPTTLFAAAPYEEDPFGIPMYDVDDDGRFLMVRRGTGSSTWRWITGWDATLQAAAPRH